MALTKAIAVKVAAYSSGWLNRHRFVQSSDGGKIYIEKDDYLVRGTTPPVPDTVMTFFALGKNHQDVSPDKIDELSHCRTLNIVVPCNAVSHELLTTLEKIESSWIDRSVDEDPQNPLLEKFSISLVGDIGKDLKTGETRYACDDMVSFAGEIYKRIGRGLANEGRQVDLCSLSDVEMRATLKKSLLGLKDTATTLSQVNKTISNAKRV